MSLSRQVGAHRIGSQQRYGWRLGPRGTLALAAHTGTNKIRLQGLLSRTRAGFVPLVTRLLQGLHASGATGIEPVTSCWNAGAGRL